MAEFREWQKGDELARLFGINEELQFGMLLQEGLDGQTFVAKWRKPDESAELDSNYNPNNEALLGRIDRAHSEGEKVTHVDSGKIGEILEAVTQATIYLPDFNCIIENVPLSLLKPLSMYTGELFLYRGWIGKVGSVVYRALIEYSGGHRAEIIITQDVKTNKSTGFEMYEKSSPPYAGMLLTPNNKEFQTAEWKGQGFLDSLQHLVHQYFQSEGKIISSEIERIHPKWVCSVDASAPHPKDVLDKSDLKDIDDFDICFKNGRKLRSLCEYIVRRDDEPFDEKSMESRLVTAMQLNVPSPQPQMKRRKVQENKTKHVPGEGSKHVVEVVQIRHMYAVLWNGYEGERCREPDRALEAKLELGSDLSPVSRPTQPFRLENSCTYQREFVTMKYTILPWQVEDYGSVFGVTQHRDFRSDWWYVDFYEMRAPHQRTYLGRRQMSRFDLCSHHVYGSINPGVIVRKNGMQSQVGTVFRINRYGLVEVQFGKCTVSNPPSVCCPSELQVVSGLAPPSPPQPPELLAASQVFKFNSNVAQDLEDFLYSTLRNPRTDIRIKAVEGVSNKFLILMTGFVGTPYEDGLFPFLLHLNADYPESAPTIELEILPRPSEFLSYSIAQDGKVLQFRNMAPSVEKEYGYGWNMVVSLGDFLREIREEVFQVEPVLSFPGLRFRGKDTVFDDVTVLAKSLEVNSSALITTLDMLISLRDDPPAIWTEEIEEHYAAVGPKMKKRLEGWMNSMDGVYQGNLNEAPKFHIFPMSEGLKTSLRTRLTCFDGADDDDTPRRNENAKH